MGATLTLGKLIGPIAAATIVTVFWFAAMWRGHQMERGGMKLPRRYAVALFGYIAALGLVVYFMQGVKISTGIELFAATLAGEGLGIVVVMMLVEAFILSRGRRWSDRAMPIVFGLLLASCMFATVFTT